jgi:KaiC/GvpD/RAD55 family RecA-like ATPase
MLKADLVSALKNRNYPILTFMLSKENYNAESLEILQYVANDGKTIYVNLDKSFDEILMDTSELGISQDSKFIIGDDISIRDNKKLRENCIILPKGDSLVALSLKIPQLITKEDIKYCVLDHVEGLLRENDTSELDSYILYLVHNLRTFDVRIIFLIKKNDKSLVIKKILDNYAITFDLL